MNENLIVDDNTIYEIDPECMRKKREQQRKQEETKNNIPLKQRQNGVAGKGKRT